MVKYRASIWFKLTRGKGLLFTPWSLEWSSIIHGSTTRKEWNRICQLFSQIHANVGRRLRKPGLFHLHIITDHKLPIILHFSVCWISSCLFLCFSVFILFFICCKDCKFHENCSCLKMAMYVSISHHFEKRWISYLSVFKKQVSS